MVEEMADSEEEVEEGGEFEEEDHVNLIDREEDEESVGFVAYDNEDDDEDEDDDGAYCEDGNEDEARDSEVEALEDDTYRGG